jgi:hypothetical protein
LRNTGLDYIRIVEDKDRPTTERMEKLVELVKSRAAVENPFIERLNEAINAYQNR